MGDRSPPRCASRPPGNGRRPRIARGRGGAEARAPRSSIESPLLGIPTLARRCPASSSRRRSARRAPGCRAGDIGALGRRVGPCPVIGSLRTTASARPRTGRPDGSLATGRRTTGVRRPDRVACASVTRALATCSASHGTCSRRSPFMHSRCSCAEPIASNASNGPPGTPSRNRISHGPLRVRHGIANSSPTSGTIVIRTASPRGTPLT